MNISCTFKNFEASDHLKKYARRKMEKLGRFFGKSSNLDVNLVLTVDKIRHRCEITVNGEGLHLNASEQCSDMYASIDLVFDKIESQIKRHVEKVKEHRRKARNTEVDIFTYHVDQLDEAENSSTSLIGTDRFAPKPLHLEEALMELDSVGGDFLVFLNAENGRINVVYKRKTMGYAIIDPIL